MKVDLLLKEPALENCSRQLFYVWGVWNTVSSCWVNWQAFIATGNRINHHYGSCPHGPISERDGDGWRSCSAVWTVLPLFFCMDKLKRSLFGLFSCPVSLALCDRAVPVISIPPGRQNFACACFNPSSAFATPGVVYRFLKSLVSAKRMNSNEIVFWSRSHFNPSQVVRSSPNTVCSPGQFAVFKRGENSTVPQSVHPFRRIWYRRFSTRWWWRWETPHVRGKPSSKERLDNQETDFLFNGMRAKQQRLPNSLLVAPWWCFMPERVLLLLIIDDIS